MPNHQPSTISTENFDIDHSGSAAELKRITGAKVAIHSGDAPSLSGEKELKRVKGFIGVIFRLMQGS